MAISADALQVYEGLGDPDRRPTAEERERLEHRLVGLRAGHGGVLGRRLHAAGPPGDRRRAGRRAGGRSWWGDRPLPAGRAHRADASRRRRRPSCVSASRPRARGGRAALHAELAEPGATGGGDHRADATARGWCERSSSRDGGGARGRRASPSSGPARRGGRRCSAASSCERDELYARIDARVDAMVAAGAVDEVRRADAAGASRTARAALGFEELLAGDVDAMKRRTRNYAKRQLTWMRKLPDVRQIDLTGREPAMPRLRSSPPREVREVAGARQRLHHRRRARPSLPADARAGPPLRRPPKSAPTACCCCAGTNYSRFRGRAAHLQPDGSEAELSGNGVRQAVMYLHPTAGPTSTLFR